LNGEAVASHDAITIPMKGLRLYKKEKLCNAGAIDSLFGHQAAIQDVTPPARMMAYPLRALWRINNGRRADCPQFLIVIPKKRLRHAVDRVAMRRRVREAYRLNRHLIPRDVRVDIAFIWVADSRVDSASIHRAMVRILGRIGDSLSSLVAEPQ